ncbi:hypothetical protein EL22_27460 [Halostagnicola sp. A56]|uniref:hypothetical protein n=1 Tax=Halostagnicola sp. A56 TaxID=1495067 RepID=UPI00065F69B7|nr:hypothetical protein [Halostagnicola sp. A56]KMT45808.1 hypothetical protein EL22_27460 [Halostagnicola sp. A56]
MNPSRVDFLVDLAYGLMIFVSVVLFNFVGTRVGIAFGLGVMISYVIHVVWKMARFDPEWMTKEVTQNVEDTLTREVDEVIDKLETVNERVDRRPRAEEVEETVDQKVDETVDEKVDETVDKKVDQTVDEKVVETALRTN